MQCEGGIYIKEGKKKIERDFDDTNFVRWS